MKRVAMGLCALGAATLAHAGSLDKKLELGVGLGVAGYRGDVDNGEYTPAGDLHGCWWFSDRAGLDLIVGVTTLRAEEANVGFSTPLSSLAGRIVCLPFHEMAVDP